MFSLDCPHYKKSFNRLDDLIDDVLEVGQDPNYEIMKNGKQTGETIADLLTP